jgi:hypothetical protein
VSVPHAAGRFRPSIHFVVALAPLTVGCGSTEPSTPIAFARVVTGIVTDSLGRPLTDVLVSVRATRRKAQPAIGSSVRTDGNGRYRVTWQLPAAGIDSFIVETNPERCSPYRTAASRQTGSALLLPVGDSITINLQLGLAYPLARLVPSEMCGQGYEHFASDVAAFRVRLLFEDTSDSLRGQWFIGYDVSRRPDAGTFTGRRVGEWVMLDLAVAPTERCVPGYRLWIPLGANGDLGEAWYQGLGPCPAAAGTFRFVVYDDPAFP